MKNVELFEDERFETLKKLSKLIFHTFVVYWFIFSLTCIKFIKVDKKEINYTPTKFVKPELHLYEKKSLEELHQDYLQMKKQQAFDLANEYLKYRMDCYKLAIKYIKELKGLNNVEKIEIDEEDVELGDLVFYRNNGYGQTHWSVVLDLENNIALHGSGNFNRQTIIRKVYEPNMAKPKFYRLVEKESE